MHAVKLSFDAGPTASGGVTARSPSFTGRVLAIIYTKPSSGSYTDGVDAVFTLNDTGQAILTVTNMNASAVYYPRVPVQDEAGAAATLDGTRAMRDYVVGVQDRVKVVITSAGDDKTGTFTIIVG